MHGQQLWVAQLFIEACYFVQRRRSDLKHTLSWGLYGGDSCTENRCSRDSYVDIRLAKSGHLLTRLVLDDSNESRCRLLLGVVFLLVFNNTD